MNRSRIAIDIDDVLVDRVMAIQSHLNSQLGARLDVSRMQSGDSFFEFVVNYFANKVSRAQLSQIIEDYVCSDEYMSIPPSDVAVQVIQKLSAVYELLIVSQRPKRQHEVTKGWIQKYFGDSFSQIFIINSGHFGNDILPKGLPSKAAFCHDQACDYIIDDRLQTCLDSATYDIKALLFGEYSWNAPTTLPQDVVRVKDWQSVEEFFDGRGSS